MKARYIVKAVELITVITLCRAMLVLPIAHYLCLYDGLYFSYIVDNAYKCGVYCLAALLINIVVRQLISERKIELSRYEMLFSVMLVCLLISWRTAIDPDVAFNGYSGRNEGLLMLCFYYIYFYAARTVTNEKSRSFMINFFIAVLGLHATYGLAQFFHFDYFVPVYDHYFYAVSGVAGNPNFMGTLMVMGAAAAMGLAIYSRNIIAKIIYFCMLVLFTATLIFTKTMSSYLGFACTVFVVIILMLRPVIRQRSKSVIAKYVVAIILSAIILIVIIDKLTYGFISREIELQLKNSLSLETFASGRLLVWLNILKMLPRYLPFGVGIDCLVEPYYESFGLFNGVFLDKAHNELLHILITMGLPVFICYIALYCMVFKDLKDRLNSRKDKVITTTLLLILTGYICQGMFNISIIDVAPYFWIMLGLSAKPLFCEENSDMK